MKLRAQFASMWKQLDATFRQVDEVLEGVDQSLEEMSKTLDAIPEGDHDEVIREEETKPDGTRVIRVIKRRSTKVTR